MKNKRAAKKHWRPGSYLVGPWRLANQHLTCDQNPCAKQTANLRLCTFGIPGPTVRRSDLFDDWTGATPAVKRASLHWEDSLYFNLGSPDNFWKFSVEIGERKTITIYYRKRGSASYIVRQWLLWVVVVERERERERERDACDVNRYHAEIASDHAYDYLDGVSTLRVDAFWACRVLECM